jgi:eukaryotic-like serine/threonine-protein kinase
MAAGTTFAGGYRIQNVMGEGASGVVYLAERVGDGDRVALKVIHRHLVRDRQISRRFHREASILRKVRCPQIVALLDFGELDDGVLYLALEYAEGHALDEITRAGPLEPRRAARITKDICQALEVAHAAGVVHRDLKPGNVIVEGAGESERARVLDFGMAKVLRGDPTDSLNLLTERNMVFGTPEYMAPEQARGDEVDGRCDVYAAGVMLYEMLTGSVPFNAGTPIGVMTAHLVERPEPPSGRAPRAAISPALEAVVLHALAKERIDRYASANALARALYSALDHPGDVISIAPPAASSPDADLATRDTERALRVPAALRLRASVDRKSESTSGGRLWILVAVIAALAGIAGGVLASLWAH